MKEEAVSKEKIYGKHELMTPIPIMHCPGCHYGTIIRLICEVIDELGIEDRAIGLAGVGCSFAWPMYLDIDMTSCPHGRAPAMATAIKRLHPDTVVFTCQGDGDLGAIGLGCFMNSLLRGEKLTTIFLNNAVYGTTGGQMAPTTLLEMRTTTTPYGRDTKTTGFPLHAAELAATMKGVAFSARCALNSPANFNRAKKAVKTAFLKQMDGVGYGFVEFLSACPPNWGLTPVDALKFISEKMITEYPLGEFKNVDSI
ncbi:MAG: thiamine pyrophosphate-dependent enzyme [Thermodesulfobacteriota bacterium]|nr:thiamine pyrophosphate-dependent enzyme [Thermodesulfobacteriota bacterium]